MMAIRMHERTQIQLYAKKYRRPELFATFTSDPAWIDVINELYSNQQSYDRQDIVCRVFRLNVNKLINLLTKSKICGSIISFVIWMYVLHWVAEKTTFTCSISFMVIISWYWWPNAAQNGQMLTKIWFIQYSNRLPKSDSH